MSEDKKEYKFIVLPVELRFIHEEFIDRSHKPNEMSTHRRAVNNKLDRFPAQLESVNKTNV